MGYLHIPNLYKDQDVLLFKECWAMEKVHGTSTWISWKDNQLSFFSGGVKHENFIALFNQEEMREKFVAFGQPEMRIVGEGYGGKCQGMKDTYGPDLSFVAFEVRIGHCWLTVPQAEKIVVEHFGLEFVPYVKCSTNLEELDRERDRDSIVAIRRGMGEGKKREGIVIRPPVEVVKNNGERIIAKHKRDDFRETKTPRKPVAMGEKTFERKIKAQEAANEYATEMRLTHVMDKVLPGGEKPTPERTKDIILAMLEDIEREAMDNEIEWNKETKKAISAKTAQMYKQRMKNLLQKRDQ